MQDQIVKLVKENEAELFKMIERHDRETTALLAEIAALKADLAKMEARRYTLGIYMLEHIGGGRFRETKTLRVFSFTPTTHEKILRIRAAFTEKDQLFLIEVDENGELLLPPHDKLYVPE
jgi:non-ribosomal peptide synthetase component E (peptide arylation enzyme)